MEVTCPQCGHQYDDAWRTTICPHEMLMPRQDMERKIEAIELMRQAQGKHLRFKQGTKIKGKYRLLAVVWNGMIEIEGMPGQFSPGSFEVVD